jgi:hypothetical protein
LLLDCRRGGVMILLVSHFPGLPPLPAG